MAILKGYNCAIVLPLCCVTGAMLRVLPGHLSLPEMTTAETIAAPIGLFAALLVAICILTSTPEPVREIALSGAREWKGLRTRRLMLVAIGCSLPSVIVLPSQAGVAISAVSAMTGEGLLLAAVNARVAWLVPLAHLSAAAVFGTDGVGRISWWAWLIRPSPSLSDYALGLFLFAFGTRFWSRSSNVSQ